MKQYNKLMAQALRAERKASLMDARANDLARAGDNVAAGMAEMEADRQRQLAADLRAQALALPPVEGLDAPLPYEDYWQG